MKKVQLLPRVHKGVSREVHIRKHPDDACIKPVWCGGIGKASITASWGYYGPGGDGYDDVCRGCIDAQGGTS